MRNIRVQKGLYFFVLIVLPVLYFATGFFFQLERGFYFINSVDPEYCYLFNSLNISQFTLKVWHVDHPGTPIQLLGALVIRVVHLFCGKEPLLQDVMHNSAFYARAITVTIFSLSSIALLTLGRVAFRLYENIFTALFFQLTPFASYLVLTLILRINPEHVAVFSVILLSILVLKYLNRPKPSGKWIDWYLIGFAFVAGFTVAVKVTFLPLVFVPFFLFKGFIMKAFYIIFSGISFILFILPVLYYRHEYFFGWIKSLFVHSGVYGAGKANIIDKNAYVNALHTTFSFNFLFSFVFILVVIACLGYLLPFVKKRFRNDGYYKLLIGIVLAMIMQILLIAKQFSYHYLTPALLLITLGFFTVSEIFLKKTNILVRNLIFVVLAVYILYIDYAQVLQYHESNSGQKKEYNKTYNFIQQNKTDEALIIVPSYYGCPYQEYALYFGLDWCGNLMEQRYVDVLNTIYPNTYFYNGWDELFHNWKNDPISYIDLLKKHGSIRLFSGDSTIEKNIMTYVTHNIRRANDTEIKSVFSNETTGENIYEINYIHPDTADTLLTLCSADSLCSNAEKFIGTRNQLFNNGNSQSSDFARSGKFSSKVTSDNPYGMTYIIGQVRTKEHYRINVWRHIGNNDASLVVEGRVSDDLFLTEKKSDYSHNDWEELTIDFIVPETMNNKELRIHPHNDSSSPAYFDDMEVIAQ
ncbi:MAG: hypothetical protein V1904_10930 [Bacteroidota bacterium]